MSFPLSHNIARGNGRAPRSPTHPPLAGGVLSTIGNTPLVPLRRLFPRPDLRLFAKMESANPGGSIKDRTAFTILSRALEAGELHPGDTVIESSSGNMAIGLAQACRYFGLKLIIVVDPKVNALTLNLLEAFDVTINAVKEPDPDDGWLGARLTRVAELLETVPNSYWSNQYANPNNPAAHEQTMHEIVRDLGAAPDYLFVATSTCGTIMGCAQYVQQHGLHTRLVAVDAVGSVIFGTPPAPRLIPGHGAGRASELLERHLIDDVIHVSDMGCVRGCRLLLEREAILAGGSSGGVVSAIERRMSTLPEGATVAFLVCDRGDRYLETIYSDEWVLTHLGDPAHDLDAGA